MYIKQQSQIKYHRKRTNIKQRTVEWKWEV